MQWNHNHTINDGSDRILSIAVAPHTPYFVTSRSNVSEADIWEYDTWNKVGTLSLSGPGRTSHGPSSDFSPDGNWLGIATDSDDGVAIFSSTDENPSNWSQETYLEANTSSTGSHGVSFTPEYVAVVDSWSLPTGKVFETGTWNSVADLTTNSDGTWGRSISFSPDNQYIAVGDANGNCGVWTVGTSSGSGWNKVTEFDNGTTNDTGGLTWSPDSNWLVRSQWGGQVDIFSVGNPDGSGWSRDSFIMAGGSVYTPRFDPRGEYLAVPEGYGGSGSVGIYDIGTWNHNTDINPGSGVGTIESAAFDDPHHAGIPKLFYGNRSGNIYIADVNTDVITEMSGTVTVEGTPTSQATVRVVDVESEEVAAVETPSSDGTWSTMVNSDNTYHVLAEYDVSGRPSSGIARWEFEQDVSDSWNGYNATDSTSAGYVTDAPVGSYAKSFDGVDDYVTLPTLPNVFDGSSDWTISHWLRVDSSHSGLARLFHPRGQNDTGTLLRDNGDFEIGWWSTGGSDYATASNLPTETWVHAVGVWDSTNGEIRAYTDGTLRGTGNTGSPYSANSENAIGYRADNNNNYFAGDIDDVRLYEKALTDNEVSNLYDTGSIDGVDRSGADRLSTESQPYIFR